MKKGIGEYLRELRKSEGFTLTQMGAKLGMDSGALSKIENGKRILDAGYLPIVAQVFNLDLEILKTEFFAEKIANELIENSCNESTLRLAEEKIKYIKVKTAEQTKLEI
ncbi:MULTISPECIES: helix-turn-helix domain-containing protein [Aequorivita]|jgi:transcriptional regulator with XRE-family HTH domain|uniref:Helix-turn-helix transcriptional regulator n=2 Tax=Aequorivita TaxID=153265 RepID=A0AB35YXP6_9FLAO|nr:helix-turn-helix transcriptional regulator [Aequorivita sp. Ant34-E75]WGF92137.1 helix-turn-helix transcriptional regulator [Aequorivita sp. Ant34-E75]